MSQLDKYTPDYTSARYIDVTGFETNRLIYHILIHIPYIISMCAKLWLPDHPCALNEQFASVDIIIHRDLQVYS